LRAEFNGLKWKGALACLRRLRQTRIITGFILKNRS